MFYFNAIFEGKCIVTKARYNNNTKDSKNKTKKEDKIKELTLHFD